MKRRDFFKLSIVASATVLVKESFASKTTLPIDSREISAISFPEKRPLITHSDRPPLLETPREVFTTSITPNDQFFVRWHTPKIVTQIDVNDYFITISGEVKEMSYISVDMLKKEFESVEITAALQCGGNSRSAFKPSTSGIQWGNGAMGCAKWKGARLRDVLEYAGITREASYINFQGTDEPAFYKSPKLIRELAIQEISDDVIIAYEMNGEDIPLLNGYPLRLIIPGVYSDSWMKSLKEIEVTKEYKSFYYMDKAYRIADNDCECEKPKKYVTDTKPIGDMNVKSLIGYPTSKTVVESGSNVLLKGIAFDGGSGIRDVLISIDNGISWENAYLKEEISKYAFREFIYSFIPKEKGNFSVMAKAVNNNGEVQPFAKDIFWNKGGYKYNGVDVVTFKVI
jgi:sulfoxide reductase catalytic subunit YedY